MQPIESAAFSAWPSTLSTDILGWRLRLDRGYTLRANSLNATEHSQMLSDTDLYAIEAQFRHRGLAPVVRLTSCSAVPEADAWLALRGYGYSGLSRVMTRALSDVDGEDADERAWAGSAAPWLDAFRTLSHKSDDDHLAHLGILQRIEHPVAWAVQAPTQVPVCCGIGVLVDRHLGLFDIATHAGHQRQGLAQQLCRSILTWGRSRDAHTAFLQVVATNTNAIRVYERLGFKIAYSYWYRVRAMP